MTTIDTIYRQGDDALGNQWELNLSPISILSDLDSLKLRATTVEIPEHSVSTYTVEHKTQSLERIGGKITTPKQMTVNFRVDKYWGLYNAIKNWIKTIGADDTGKMAEDNLPGGDSSFRTDFSVITLDSNDIPTGGGWKFHKACPINLAGVSFDYSSGDPIEVAVTFSFIKMTDLV